MYQLWSNCVIGFLAMLVSQQTSARGIMQVRALVAVTLARFLGWWSHCFSVHFLLVPPNALLIFCRNWIPPPLPLIRRCKLILWGLQIFVHWAYLFKYPSISVDGLCYFSAKLLICIQPVHICYVKFCNCCFYFLRLY